MYICETKFSEAEAWILEKLDDERLTKWIDFLRGYKEVMWWNNDTNELVPRNALRILHTRPLPDYPDEFMEMGEYFSKLCSQLFNEMPGLKISLATEGFFQKDSLAARNVGTYYSPVLICVRIADAYGRECFCDGLFGTGVENGLYLKMLLHLEDAKDYYAFLHNVKSREERNRERLRKQRMEQMMKEYERRKQLRNKT